MRCCKSRRHGLRPTRGVTSFFTDYEREFGGLFNVDWLADDVGRAVFQFFANGGAVPWIVALQPTFHILSGRPWRGWHASCRT